MADQELIEAIDRLTQAVRRIAVSVESQAKDEQEQSVVASSAAPGPSDPGFWDWVQTGKLVH